jgi:membrane protease YdiL (CAAX protease family)
MKGIPAWAALPIAAAFLIEFPFYLLPAFDAARSGEKSLKQPWLLAGTCVAPYLLYSVPTGEFSLHGFMVLLAIALAVSYWYRLLPKNAFVDLLFIALLAGIYVSKIFVSIYLSPIPAVIRDLGILGHLMLIRTAVIAIVAIRGGVNVEFRFIPTAHEWLIGLRWFALLVPLCGAELWVQGLAHSRPQTHHGVEAVGIALAEFAGILWVVALSEEFLFRGLLQQWLGQWTGSSWGALILASIIFGSAHLGFHGPFPNWRFAFVAASFGLCCGLAWRESRTIQASMITHALGATLYRVFFQ